MVNFMNLPTVQAPRNALADFAPITQAIDGNRRNALMQLESQRQDEALAMQKDNQTYQRGRDQKQDARADVEFFGKQAAAIDRLQGPERAKAYESLLARHPARASLTPEYLDPVNGPKLIMAEAGQWRDPREDQEANLNLQIKRAQLNQLSQRANTDRVMEVGGRLVRVPQSGPAEEIYSGAPKMTPAETAVDKAYAKSYEEDVVNGGLADAVKNLNQLKEVRTQLLDKKAANLTGPLVGRLPDTIATVTNPKAVDTRERVEEVVQRNLKVVLGAQFTNEEGKRLIARAYNPALDEATNASRLSNLIGAMDQALQAKKAAAQYYEQNGTLRGLKGKTSFSVSDFENAIDGAPPSIQSNPLKSKYGLE